MHFLILLMVTLSLFTPEPQFGYWVCDAIKNSERVDIVILPNTVLIDTNMTIKDSLVLTELSHIQLNQLIISNINYDNILPISGCHIFFDSLDNTIIKLDSIKDNYTIITTQSLAQDFNSSLLFKTINQLVSTYLTEHTFLVLPSTERYQFSNRIEQKPNNVDKKININTASKEQLESLPGIGPKIAQNIIDYRNEYGTFNSIEQIKDVKGIGDKKYAALKDLIKI